MKHPLPVIIGLFAAAIVSSGVHAENVTLKLNKLTLNAHVEKAGDWPGRVVLMTHSTMANNRMEIMAGLQDAFKSKGISSLAINVSYAIDNRASASYDCAVPNRYKHADALDEIGAWLAWLKQQGAKDVVLLGHSRGGNQTAWFAVERGDPAIRRLVLIAPLTWTAEGAARSYRANYNADLAPLVKKAQALISGGKGDTLLEHVGFLYCPDGSATAAAFVSHYADDARLDTPSLVSKLKQPVLVVAATDDDVVPDAVQRFTPLADGKHIRLTVVEGADHTFRDLYAEDLYGAVIPFITEP
jgi:pimeloyl-ACP methyl ester carboxylesterase